MYYEVAYTDESGIRQFATDIRNKILAFSTAKSLLKKGCSKVYVDKYDNENDMNLIESWDVKTEEMAVAI